MNARIRLSCACRLVGSAGLGLFLTLLLAGSTAHMGPPEQAGSTSLAGLGPLPGDPPLDGDELAQTRWISIDGHPPTSFQAWRATQPPPASLRVARVYASPARSPAVAAPLVCALVIPSLYEDVAPALARWAADVEREGWSAVLYSASFPDPPALRAHLASIASLRGCLVIGDHPVPWFEMPTKEFPFDLFYMDLDGVWHDDDEDGMYEDHTGDIAPEIWIGRMTAGNLTFGRDEAGLVNNYFHKNHAYRTGTLNLPARALVYVDDDWAHSADNLGNYAAALYPDITAVSDTNTTRADDYGRRLAEYHAYIHVFAHSSARSHTFKFTEQDPLYKRTISSENIYELDPHAYFYNLFACGAARFTEADYIAGWYLFADTYGLAVWGATATGSMVRDFPDFYAPLARGEPIGDAYLSWFETWGVADRGWHYVLTMLGDPTLVVDPARSAGAAPTALTLTGPASASVGLAQPFVATVEPPTAAQPLRYTWQVTDKAPLVRTGIPQDAQSLAWTTPRIKTVVVTATNYAGTVTGTQAVTVQAPDLGLAPRALSETLVLGTELTRSLTLSNAGPGDLAFRLVETDHLLSAGAGPDLFGYTFTDSNQARGPSYEWIEIAPPAGGSGTYVDLPTVWQGGYAWPISLPFTFPFYGKTYDKLAIGSRGTLSFVDLAIGRENQPLPSELTFEVESLIAPFWDFLVIDPGAVYYQDLGDKFVVEFYRVSRYGGLDGTFEAILYQDGSMLFQYQDVDFGYYWGNQGKSATVGIQGDALTGLQYSYDTPALSDNLAICFAYPGQLPDCSAPVDAPWLSASPAEGVVPAAGERALDLVFDARASAIAQPGFYHATLVALTNDPEESVVSVPVTMTVLTPTYGLALSPLAAARSALPGQTVSYTLYLTNTGNAADVFDLAVSGAAWPTVAPAAVGLLAPDESEVLDVTVAIPPEAAHNATDMATLTVTSQGESDRWITVPLTTTAQIPEPPEYDLFLPLVVRSSG